MASIAGTPGGVLVCSPDDITRAGLATICRRSRKLGPVADVPSLTEVEPRARESAALLVDSNAVESVEGLSELIDEGVAIAVVGEFERVSVQDMLAIGVLGYVARTASADTICRTVRSVALGELYVQPAIQRGMSRFGRDTSSVPALSGREREVLELAAHGLSNKRIAVELHMGATTVKTYLQRVHEKLGTRRRAEAVASAMQLGLIDPGRRVHR